jgi:hypothetical protein
LNDHGLWSGAAGKGESENPDGHAFHWCFEYSLTG